MVNCKEIASFLDKLLSKHLYLFEIPTIWKESPYPIQRLGLALEPDSTLDAWIKEEELDAVFLHRPWKLAMYSVPDNISIVASHLPFDDQLTIGFNNILAETLRLSNLEIFGMKDGRPIGMKGTIPLQTDIDFCKCIMELVDGVEHSFQLTGKTIHKVAFVGAMTTQLIESAAKQGVELYCTGQFRESARKAVVASNISVVAVGHKRSELYGLKLLSNLLSVQWPELRISQRIPT